MTCFKTNWYTHILMLSLPLRVAPSFWFTVVLCLSFGCQSSLWGSATLKDKEDKNIHVKLSLKQYEAKWTEYSEIWWYTKPQNTWYNSGLRVVFAFNMNRQPLCPAASLFWLSRQRIVTKPSWLLRWHLVSEQRGKLEGGSEAKGGRHNGSEGLLFAHSRFLF